MYKNIYLYTLYNIQYKNCFVLNTIFITLILFVGTEILINFKVSHFETFRRIMCSYFNVIPQS